MSVRRTVQFAAFAGWLMLCAASSQAQPKVRQVLMLQSLARGNLILDSFTANFRVDLEQRYGTPVNVIEIVIGPIGFVGAPDQAVVDYVRATFPERSQPDLIM